MTVCGSGREWEQERESAIRINASIKGDLILSFRGAERREIPIKFKVVARIRIPRRFASRDDKSPLGIRNLAEDSRTRSSGSRWQVAGLAVPGLIGEQSKCSGFFGFSRKSELVRGGQPEAERLYFAP